LWSTGFVHQGGALAAPAAAGGTHRSPGSVASATDVQPVPEPGALVLAAIGFIGFWVTRKSR
jgi:hypothetical protein